MATKKCETKGGILEQQGMPLATRRATFYSVCVPVRLGIAGLVYYYRNEPSGLVLALLIGLIGTVGNLRALGKPCNEVWWHRIIHVIIFMILTLFSILAIYKIVPSWTLAAILVADVAVGVTDSFISSPFF